MSDFTRECPPLTLSLKLGAEIQTRCPLAAVLSATLRKCSESVCFGLNRADNVDV